MQELSGQVALVTGAGRGIGREIASYLARAGAAVALVARSCDELQAAASEIESLGGKALPFAADVSLPTAVEELAAQVQEQLGAVDLLVNNAGSFRGIGPLWEVTPDAWWTDVTTNLYGPFLCSRAVLPAMIERNRGRIINLIGGGAGNVFPYGSGYASSKAGLTRLTECLAAELRQAAPGVAVFAVGPGLVRTNLTSHQLESPEGQRWMERTGTQFAAGRDVPPTRAAELVIELASGKFDRLTGRAFSVFDDLDELLDREAEIIRKDQKTLRFR